MAGFLSTGLGMSSDGAKARTNQLNKAELENKFAAALASAGGAFPDASAFYRCFNSLHRMDYFDPYVTGNLHIFMTRPKLYLCSTNLALDNSFMMCTNSAEGNMILASLCAPDDDLDISNNEELVDGVTQKFSLEATKAGENAFERLKNQGLAPMGRTPFIPLISNVTTSISGIKDITLEKYEYDGDQSGHKTADAMGLDDSQSSGEFTLNSIENANLGMSMLTYLWLLYMDNTGKGLMNPSIRTVTNLEYDYMSSVYWFVTGQDGYSIKLYGKLTGVYPLNTPLTSLIPNERGSYVDPKISTTWHYNHSEIMKPEIIYDFCYLCDKAAADVTGSNITASKNSDGPMIFNNRILEWYENNYRDIEGSSLINKELHKFLPTGRNGDQLRYDYGIYAPEPQNAWMGHPYVIDGKLVYRRLNNESSGTTSAANQQKRGYFAINA